MQLHASFKAFLCTFLFFCPQTSALHAQQKWERVDALPAEQFTALFVTGDTLFAAGLNTIYQSFDAGFSWHETSVISPTLDFIEAINYNQGRLYVGTVVDGVYSSANGGQSWQLENNGLFGLGAYSISSFAVRGDSLYTGTYGAGVFVKKISNNSAWTSYNQGIPWDNIENITSANGLLFAGSGANGTVSIQKAPGSGWEEVAFASFNGSYNTFLGLTIDGDTWIAAGTLGLYNSVNQGKSWTYFNPGTGFLSAAQFVNSKGRIIVNLAKPVGPTFMKYSEDQGTTWSNFEPGLSGSYGYDLTSCKGYLYSARDNGLWRLAQTSRTGEANVVRPVLGQNFPNPFVEKTLIPVDLPESGRVGLQILDGTGRLVRSIFEGEKAAGIQHFEIDLNGLEPGIYIYRLTTDAYQESRRMILLR